MHAFWFGTATTCSLSKRLRGTRVGDPRVILIATVKLILDGASISHAPWGVRLGSQEHAKCWPPRTPWEPLSLPLSLQERAFRKVNALSRTVLAALKARHITVLIWWEGAERFVRARSHSASLLSSATCPDTARSKTAVHEICATSDLVQ